MSVSNDIIERFLSTVATLSDGKFTIESLQLLLAKSEKAIKDEYDEMRRVKTRTIELSNITSCRDPEVSSSFWLDNVTYKGENVIDIECRCLRIINEYINIDYFGYSPSTQEFYIGESDGTICVFATKQFPALVHSGTFSYEDDEKTELHKKNYHFFYSGYNRLKKMNSDIIDLVKN